MTRLYKFLCLVVLSISTLYSTSLHSQSQSEGSNSENNIFIGGVSPFILNRGQVEINNVAFLVSYWNQVVTSSFNGTIVQNIYRTSQFQNRLTASYGFSDNQKWDLGFDITYARVRLDDIARNSPFEIFSQDELNKSSVSYLGIKSRYAPLNNTPNLVFQGSVRVPIANGDELRRDLGAGQTEISLGASYFYTIGYTNSYFLTANWSLRPSMNDDFSGALRPTLHNFSAGGYLMFNIWQQSLYLIPGISYGGSFQKSTRNSDLLQRSHAVLGDLILQYQFGPNFSMNVQGSFALLFESYIPAVKFDRRSYSSLAASFRVLL